jgi:hypothetical protein
MYTLEKAEDHIPKLEIVKDDSSTLTCPNVMNRLICGDISELYFNDTTRLSLVATDQDLSSWNWRIFKCAATLSGLFGAACIIFCIINKISEI